ncbi:hypothetical protein LguiA_021814 [Lonicera macranthoides]
MANGDENSELLLFDEIEVEKVKSLMIPSSMIELQELLESDPPFEPDDGLTSEPNDPIYELEDLNIKLYQCNVNGGPTYLERCSRTERNPKVDYCIEDAHYSHSPLSIDLVRPPFSSSFASQSPISFSSHRRPHCAIAVLSSPRRPHCVVTVLSSPRCRSLHSTVKPYFFKLLRKSVTQEYLALQEHVEHVELINSIVLDLSINSSPIDCGVFDYTEVRASLSVGLSFRLPSFA